MEDRVENHESGVRRMISDTGGPSYQAFSSLVEARQRRDAIVVLEGDDGGQIHAVFPAAMVRCSEGELGVLLRDLDGLAWPRNDEHSARVLYERRSPGGGVAGGMGGGRVQEGGWVHPLFHDLGLASDVLAVARGERHRIGPPDRTPSDT